MQQYLVDSVLIPSTLTGRYTFVHILSLSNSTIAFSHQILLKFTCVQLYLLVSKHSKHALVEHVIVWYESNYCPEACVYHVLLFTILQDY